MKHHSDPRASALRTDLYELTMACAYWRAGRADREAAFHLFFRSNPFGGPAVASGLSPAADYVGGFRFAPGELDYLASLRADGGDALFPAEFLAYLKDLALSVDVDMVPEGTVVFAGEPVLRVRGPILQAQLLETALLNAVGYETLVATKAARICLAAAGDPVFEFGLRRAPGPDGGLAASRAAYVGGCSGTSNVLAGLAFGIPVKGTHAHSWVMSYDDELAAFADYVGAMPRNTTLLVDTYDTLEGVANAIEIGRRLRARGEKLDGIRLDSGDLAYLSQQARRMLDGAGFTETRIIASNDLDEDVIASLKEQGAAIDAWGVGTRLVTGGDLSSLGVVYKLGAMRDETGAWRPRIKVSDQPAKTSIPGVLQVRRFRVDGEYRGDMIFRDDEPPAGDPVLVDPADFTRRRRFPAGAQFEDLLVPVIRGGRRVAPPAPLAESRARAAEQLRRFHPGIRRFVHPHRYPVGLEERLHRLRTEMILGTRGVAA